MPSPAHVLEDVLPPRARVLFCGTAAGTVSAQVGAPYAGPGNAFWPTLHEVGLLPSPLDPSAFREAARWGIALTDLDKAAAGSDAEVGRSGFDAAVVAAKVIENALTEPTLAAEQLAGVAARTLVMCGDDDAVSLEHTIEMYRSLPDAELAVVPGTSHVLIMEKPALVTRLVLDFLTTDPVSTIMPIRRA